MEKKKSINSKKVLQEAKRLKQPFAQKIKTTDEVIKLIGKRPRTKKVAMCHGTFDIVHPGHLRQLIYSKSKADILIVTVTVDKYVAKRPISPYVPQELRALNLAAFEVVDYVIIDHNPTPIENIKKLQPDYFVKGFEYTLGGIQNPKTKEELKTVRAYGGQMLFSPGDIVYSSSELLTTNRPNLALDHLLTLIDAEGVTFNSIKTALRQLKNIKIHVIGDLIIDKYSTCTILAQTPKKPAFEARVDETETFIGGAGAVAKHLRVLGVKVTLTTVIGKDSAGQRAVKDLISQGIKVNAIIDPLRPTTIKERFITDDNHLIFQIDTIDHSMISENNFQKICGLVRKTPAQAIILSDFRHGIFNLDNIQKIREQIPPNVLKIADTQINHRWGNILDFSEFDLITPNEKEARFALADQDTGVRPLAQKLYNAAKCQYLILKLGENGTITYHSPGMDVREYYYIDTFAREVVDATGSGDALLATASAILVSTKNILYASILGNLAGSIECGLLGNIPVSKDDLLNKIDMLEKEINYGKKTSKK